MLKCMAMLTIHVLVAAATAADNSAAADTATAAVTLAATADIIADQRVPRHPLTRKFTHPDPGPNVQKTKILKNYFKKYSKKYSKHIQK